MSQNNPTGPPIGAGQVDSNSPQRVENEPRPLPDLSAVNRPTDTSAAEPRIAPPVETDRNVAVLGLFTGDEDDEDDTEDDGTPKMVVLDTFINGPGGGPYTRGTVISVRQLIGGALTDEDSKRKLARQTLNHYLKNKAVRAATDEESKLTFVKFPEGEQALTTALEDANTRADIEKQRADELQRQIDEMNKGKGEGKGQDDDIDF